MQQELWLKHKVPKDIDLIIFRFIHRDLMDQLNLEYHKKVKACNCKDYNDCKNGVCTYNIRTKINRFGIYWGSYNYRKIGPTYSYCPYIYNIYDLPIKQVLPTNY